MDQSPTASTYASASPAAFVIPYIQRVDDNGGLGIGDVGPGAVGAIATIVPPWPLYVTGEQVVLYVNGIDIGQRMDVTEADRDFPLVFAVPAATYRALGDGAHTLTARRIPPVGDPEDSAPYVFLVKTARPGGVDIDPETEFTNDNLKPPKIVPDPPLDDDKLDRATVIVERWENIAVGDRLYVSWHGMFIPLQLPTPHPYPITEADLGRATFEIPIPRAIIEQAGTGDVIVRYHVLDRVMNNSLWSPPLIVDIEDPNAPQAPWVVGTVDDDGVQLRLDDLARGDVTVWVENHTGKKDELIHVIWDGLTGGGQRPPAFLTEPKAVTRDNGTLVFTIPYAEVELLGEGSVTVTYVIERTPALVSKRRVLSILGRGIRLALPYVVTTAGDILDAAKNKSGALMFAPHQPILVPKGGEVTFVWSGLASGETRTNADGTNDTPALLPYDQILALVGTPVQIKYQVQDFNNDGTTLTLSESDWLTLNVINSDVGDPNLPAPYVAEAVNDILDPDALLAHLTIPALTRGTQVTATIDAPVPFSQTLPIGNPGRPPTFTLMGSSFIKPNEGSAATATYTVSAPGYSGTSLPYTFRIGAAAVDLPAPTVDEAPTGSLTPADGRKGATVRIPDAANLQPTDSVTVDFGGYITAAKPGATGLTFSIPPAEIARRLDSTIAVTYAVTRAGQVSTSDPLNLTIGKFSDADPSLPTPAIPEAKDGVLDLNETATATVTCVPWALIAVGQKVWLTVTGEMANGATDTIVLYTAYDVVASEVTIGLRKAIPIERLQALKDNSALTVDLRVTFDQSSDEHKAIVFPHSSYKLLNTFDFGEAYALAVAGTYVVASTRKPANPPESAKYTRTPTDGTPPYTYKSSNEQIATVDGAGNVTAWRNGVTRITATDNIGRLGSYELTVSNILVMVPNDASVRNWTDARTFASQQGSRLATITELLAFYNLYAKEKVDVAELLGWPLIGAQTFFYGAWSSSQQTAGRHWFLNFNGTPAKDTGRVDGQDLDSSGRPTMYLDPTSIPIGQMPTPG